MGQKKSVLPTSDVKNVGFMKNALPTKQVPPYPVPDDTL